MFKVVRVREYEGYNELSELLNKGWIIQNVTAAHEFIVYILQSKEL